jgi:hypothetical protein
MKISFLRILFALVGVVSFTLAVGSLAAAADKHPFTVDDYSALHTARAVDVSPDGKTILYRVSWIGTTGPSDKHEWRLIDVSGENARKLELPEKFEPFGFTKEGNSLYGVLPVGNFGQLAIVPQRWTADANHRAAFRNPQCENISGWNAIRRASRSAQSGSSRWRSHRG